MCSRVIEDSTQLNDIELLTLVQTLCLFGFFESDEFLGAAIELLEKNAENATLGTVSRACFVLSFVELDKEVRVKLLAILENKVSKWLLRKTDQEQFLPINAVDLLIAVTRLQAEDQLPFRWQEFAWKRVMKSLNSMADWVKIVVFWTAAFYNPQRFQSDLKPLVEHMVIKDVLELTFYDKYMLNQLKIHAKMNVSSAIFDSNFAAELKNYEISRACETRLSPERFASLMYDYGTSLTSISDAFGACFTNTVHTCASGVQVYIPVIETSENTTILVFNDKENKFTRNSALSAANMFILQSEDKAVFSVSLSDLLGYYFDEEPKTKEQIEQYRKELLEHLLDEDFEEEEEATADNTHVKEE